MRVAENDVFVKPGDLVCLDPDALNEEQRIIANMEGVFMLLKLPSIGSQLDIAMILAGDQICPTHLRRLKKYESAE